MNPNFHHRLLTTAFLLLTLILSGCEIETSAIGTVKDGETGAPIVGAHVMEIAISKKSEQLICEGYTDSTGNFSIDAGLSGFGPLMVHLKVIVEKDGYGTVIAENNYAALNIRMNDY